MMERLIIDKLRESRGVSIGSYKGYSLRANDDNTISIYRNGNLVLSCEDEKEAYDYIDDAPVSRSNKKSVLNYCVKVLFSPTGPWFYLCKDGHYRKESQVTKNNIRKYDSKNKAEQSLKYSTRSLECIDKKVEILR